MIEVNIYQAKDHFLDILNKVESGEEVIIEDSGRQVARIVPILNKRKKRILGLGKGKIKIKPGTFHAMEEARNHEKLKAYNDIDDFFSDLEK